MLERVRGTLICMRGGGVESGARMTWEWMVRMFEESLQGESGAIAVQIINASTATEHVWCSRMYVGPVLIVALILHVFTSCAWRAYTDMLAEARSAL
jgi:hypothetical protein